MQGINWELPISKYCPKPTESHQVQVKKPKTIHQILVAIKPSCASKQ